MAKNVERLQAREAKELIRREKQLGARSNKFYLIYLFMILSLIYITDEIASTISIQFQAVSGEYSYRILRKKYGYGIRRGIIALFRHRFYFLSGNTAYYFLSSPCGQIRA